MNITGGLSTEADYKFLPSAVIRLCRIAIICDLGPCATQALGSPPFLHANGIQRDTLPLEL